jgi:hypothetical protein
MTWVTRIFVKKMATYKLLSFGVSCLICLGPVSAQTAVKAVAGDYEGTLGSSPHHLKLRVWLSSPTTLTGNLDSVDEDAVGLPCAEFVLSGNQLSFTVPSVHGSYEGEISADGNTITGRWEDQGHAVPQVFTRTMHPGISAIEKSAASSNSQWAHFGPDRKLVYATTSKGDRIPDFSSAGYRGGGIALPHVTTRMKMTRQ